MALTGAQGDIHAAGWTGIWTAGHEYAWLQGVITLSLAVDADTLICLVLAHKSKGALAALVATAITAALLHLSQIVDATGDTGFASESCRIAIFDGLIAGEACLAHPATSVTTVIAAHFGLTLIGHTVWLAGNALEELLIAGFRFQAFAAGGTTISGDAALLADARALVLDTDVAFGAVVAFRADTANVLPFTLIPTALLIRDEEGRHEALGNAGRHAHAALALPISWALAATAATGIIATLLAETIGSAVYLLNADVAEEL